MLALEYESIVQTWMKAQSKKLQVANNQIIRKEINE